MTTLTRLMPPHARVRSFFVALILSLGASGTLWAAAPLKVLLITGGCCHDYSNQKVVLAEGISARAHVSFTIVQDPSTGVTGRPAPYHQPNWADGYDVILHNECFSDEKELDWLERIAAPHRGGVPGVVVHCAMHCYRAPTNTWFDLVGVKSHRHGSHFAYYQKTDKPDHPIMKGYPSAYVSPLEELYNISEVFPDSTVLASGWSHETKRYEPNIWVSQFGKGRIFGTTIGHYNHAMQDPLYLDVLTRGLLWACGKLGEDGEPLPGYAGKLRMPSASATWSRTQRFPDTERPRPLFNQVDLRDWVGTAPYWSAKDGVITARNDVSNAPKASTYLLTKKKYRNFRLILEGKLAVSEMHSGISFWGQPVAREGDTNSYQGHLVMFPGGWGFWDLYRRDSIYSDDGRAQKAGKQHDWNQMEILAIGSRIRLAVNGREVADWTDPKPELCQEAPIGLQLHSNTVAQEVQFRGLVISENPEDRLITVQAR